MKSYNQPSFQPRDESRPRRAYEYNNCDIVEKTNFLGQQYPSQIPSWVWENRSPGYPYGESAELKRDEGTWPAYI